MFVVIVFVNNNPIVVKNMIMFLINVFASFAEEEKGKKKKETGLQP